MEHLVHPQISPFLATLPKYHFHIFPTYHVQPPAKNLIIRHSLFMNHSPLFNSATTPVKAMPAFMVDGIYNTSPSTEVLELWKNADAVCFDVDSTVCLDEGIDELAEFCETREAVAELTARAMTGFVPFEKALADRLSIIKPSMQKVKEFITQRPPRISPGIVELVKKLKDRNVDVFLISGGFRQMIDAVALLLGVPPSNVFANRLLFGSMGEFVGFDREEPTSRSGGKAIAVEHIRRVHGHRTVFMIGDGATDLEARKPGGADVFICYAGVQLRKSVAAEADWVVHNFAELLLSLD